MRIVRIEGQNLASLEHFVIDFEREPLKSAGLFAITGPTGAGKSTLLDSLCAALYDRTPRLKDSGGARIADVAGKEDVTIGANDVRSLVRRGAGAAFAEVEFVGLDGERYVARWEVWRARKQPDGRLQNQSVSLKRVRDRQALGSTKTETLEKIQELVGLTFEQFRRAVLLAQGDFAAFLRADRKERAELLERMTGTEIYGEISKQAHLEAAAQKRALDLVEAERRGVAALGPEERERLEDELRRAMSDAEGAGREARAALDASIWYARRANLQRELDRAKGAVEEADRKLEEARPLVAELREVEEVEEHRARLSEIDRASSDLDRALRSLKAAEAEAEKARQAEADSRAATEKARALLASRREAVREAEPMIQEARRLDALLVPAEKARDETGDEVARRRDEAERAAAAIVQLVEAIEKLEAESREIEAWLEDRGEDARLAEGWPMWDQLTSDCARLGENLEKALAACEQARSEALRAASRAGTAKGALAAKAGELERAAGEVRRLEAIAAEIDPAVLREEGDRIEEDRGRLWKLNDLAGRASAARKRGDGARALAGDARQAAFKAAEAAEAAEARVPELDSRCAQAEKALREMEASLGLADRRALLVEEEPCPLCGSREHPWARDGAPAPTEHEARRAELGDSRRELDGLREGIAHQKAVRAEKEKEAVRAVGDEDEAQAEIEGLRSAWCETIAWPGGAGLPDDPSMEGAENAVQARLDRIEACRREQDESARELERRGRAAATAREARDVAQRELKEAEAKAAEAEKAEIALRAAFESLNRDVEALLGRREEVLSRMEPLWSGEARIRQRLLAEPDALGREWRERVGAWKEKAERGARLGRELDALGPRRENATANQTSRQAELAAAEQRLRERERERDELRAARRAQLGGRAAGDVERELGAAVAAAEGSEKAAAHAAQEAGVGLARAEADLANARGNAEDAKAAQESAARRIDEVLSALRISPEELRRRLGHDQAWMKERRECLATLRGEVDSARALYAAREREVVEHDASPAPSIDREEVENALTQARERQTKASELVGSLRGKRTLDDEARGKAATLDERLAAGRSQALVWQRIDVVIGSADGKKFREFAQSLTLDALLGYANRHLEELARRYRLARVPNDFLEIQIIDRDMGGEARSLNTLSGGETFLASLALALGLASLASATARIESLFIDEGFGSLDPDTLEQAISVLDGLQAMGRKVAVISHVPGLAERLGVQVRVRPLGAGRSAVEVVA